MDRLRVLLLALLTVFVLNVASPTVAVWTGGLTDTTAVFAQDDDDQGEDEDPGDQGEDEDPGDQGEDEQ
jgi:hypothetical protein